MNIQEKIKELKEEIEEWKRKIRGEINSFIKSFEDINKKSDIFNVPNSQDIQGRLNEINSLMDIFNQLNLQLYSYQTCLQIQEESLNNFSKVASNDIKMARTEKDAEWKKKIEDAIEKCDKRILKKTKEDGTVYYTHIHEDLQELLAEVLGEEK